MRDLKFILGAVLITLGVISGVILLTVSLCEKDYISIGVYITIFMSFLGVLLVSEEG